MPKSKIKNSIKDFVAVVVGVILLASAINMFYDPNKLVVGGFTGLGIIINAYAQSLFGIEISLSAINIILNAPLFISAFFILGKRAIARTVFATAFLSVALELTENIPVFTGDILLASIYGGVVAGVGIGLVFRGRATTGGVDTIASMVHKFKNHLTISKIIFILDACIIVAGFFVFGAESAMYAVISVFITSKCIDTILAGMGFAKAAFIVSEKSEIIGNEILNNAKRGVTVLKGKGMYTGNEKDILLCVFAQKEITKIKEIVQDIDKNAFIMLMDIHEVLGEGFQPFE